MTDGSISNSISAGGLIATVPTGYRPTYDAEYIDTASKKRIYFAIDGKVMATDPLTAGTYLRGTFLYI